MAFALFLHLTCFFLIASKLLATYFLKVQLISRLKRKTLKPNKN
ncbi:hypothetical protein PCARR_a1357 [Pseudoalteromonas carrageenovora IAM 12662]|uniref:Uncharacterized protein n=1 Tax=Pseudoalteromonas carrageenovora IAM 12662 TaxID=1314868 RepID=A0ABR9ERA5_PSEVC|nr:hypothetical protein [Pseudoalteromonas carrageenovora IAM 12662]